MKMAAFRYTAYTESGDFRRGDIEAHTVEEANDALWAMRLAPIETRRIDPGGAANPWWRREMFVRRSATAADVAGFTRELATLEQAEVPIDDALRIMIDQGTSPAIRRLAERLLAEVLDGSTLSSAMAGDAKTFGEDYVHIVRAGESSGEIERVLCELADLLERRLEIRNRLRSALLYPAILVAAACASTSVILGVLVPSVAPIFAESHRPMPAGLRTILNIEDNWLALACGLGAAASFLWIASRLALARPGAIERLDRLKLRAPVLGVLTAQRDAARFARTLGALIRSGVPLLQAMSTSRGVVVNRHLRSGIEGAADAVRDGESLGGALARVDGLPALVRRLIVVGEESRRVDQMLLRVATLLEQQAQQRTDRLVILIAPALTISIAGVVGALIMSVMTAILSINDLASQ
ncbi:MAG: type II secretion system F family protein [Roseiarcus sp.]|jgi:general secretion pathway protein F